VATMGVVSEVVNGTVAAVAETNPLLLMALAVAVLLYYISAPNIRGVAPPPQPWYPILGNTIEFVSSADILPDFCLKHSRINGFKSSWPLSILNFGPLRTGGFVLTTPDCVKHVLKDRFERYEKTKAIQETLSDFLGNGIFTSDGATWLLHRKVAVKMFSRKFLREATFVAAEQAGKVVDRIDGFSKAGEEFDLQNLMFAFTMDVFSLIAFGVDLQSVERKERHPFAVAFDTVQALSNDRFPNPWWKYGRMLRSGGERKILACSKEMHRFAADVIASKREDMVRGQELGADLLSRFIEKKDMDNQEMIDVVLNFMIAGRDTTAAGLSWTMYELLKDPQHITIIRKEIETVLAEKFGGARFSELSHEDMFAVVEGKLPYLRAVVLEGLRLHPSVMKDMKFCVEDDELPDGTRVKKGMFIIYAPYVLCRNPHVWEEPDAFKPGRFLEKVGVDRQLSGDVSGDAATASLHKAANVSDYAYPVFNGGPRVCLGRPLALLEMMLMLATILPDYDFAFSRPNDGTYTSSLVSQLKQGLHVKATPRS